MMKTFTYFSKRLSLAVLALVAFTGNAFAGSTFYAYYTEATAYPTGKGQVYLSQEYDLDTDTVKWKDSAENQQVATSATLNLYTKPAEGYLFAGYCKADTLYNADKSQILGFTPSDSILGTDNPAFLTLSNTVTDDPEGSGQSDSLTVAGMMPLDPTDRFFALFTKIKVGVAEGQSSIGSATISKLCNDTGDNITLTAIPGEGSTFAGWMVDDMIVSSEATLNVQVGADPAEYIATFDNPNLITLHFDEWGSYLPWCDETNDLMLSGSGIYAYAFAPDSTYLSDAGAITYCVPGYSEYMVSATQPRLLYGYGDCKALKVPSDYIYFDDTDINRWSGETGVKVDTLAAGYKYYTMGTDDLGYYLRLNLAEETIPAEQVYVAMPDSVFKNLDLVATPTTIYTSVWDTPDGVKGVKAFTLPGFGKVYALDGKEVAAPKQDGIYIKNGKKVVIKK